jgi:hypothetical protein
MEGYAMPVKLRKAEHLHRILMSPGGGVSAVDNRQQEQITIVRFSTG